MSDFALPWAGDLSIDATGDYAIADGTSELQERVVRRWLSNSAQAPQFTGNPAIQPDYLWDRNYGGNARAYVDSLVGSQTAAQIKNSFLNQLTYEAEAATSPTPVVNVTQVSNGIVVDATIALQNGQVVLIPQLEIVQ